MNLTNAIDTARWTGSTAFQDYVQDRATRDEAFGRIHNWDGFKDWQQAFLDGWNEEAVLYRMPYEAETLPEPVLELARH